MVGGYLVNITHVYAGNCKDLI